MRQPSGSGFADYERASGAARASEASPAAPERNKEEAPRNYLAHHSSEAGGAQVRSEASAAIGERNNESARQANAWAAGVAREPGERSRGRAAMENVPVEKTGNP
jgi:hypothetical protein